MRLVGDIGGELGPAERRAKRHQEDREGKNRKGQRERDGARHHHPVVAEEPVGGVVKHGEERPSPTGNDGARRRRIAFRPAGSKLDIRHFTDSNGFRFGLSILPGGGCKARCVAWPISRSPCAARR